MKTIITESVREAAGILRRGGIVAFPTETVYGLGAPIFNPSSISRIFEAKSRPADNPLIAHISDLSQIEDLTEFLPDYGKRIIDAFYPGPLTIVVRKKPTVPDIATAGLDSVGIRMPDQTLARELIEAAGTPLVAPSANVSGKPSPTTWQAVLEDLDGRIDCILKGETTRYGLESTVVDCTGGAPSILRRGAVTFEELKTVVPEITDVADNDPDKPKSPGLKHRHYSPSAAVAFYTPNAEKSESAYIGIAVPSCEFRKAKIVNDAGEYARVLYEFFRECDRDKIDKIYCEEIPETGIGAAVMDRIRRAIAR
ncbi:MAG: L-threonylcarbamoyladenylate synthase [Pyrinomonadaceae bacterium]